MPAGGPRPGGGKKNVFKFTVNGKTYDDIKDAASEYGVTIQTIRNWCDNPKKPDCFKEPLRKSMDAGKVNLPSTPPDEVFESAESDGMTPLEYMLKIMNDPTADEDRRDKMAYWAAPYVVPKATVKEKSKKGERKEKAEQAASSGKFQPAKAPLKRVK